MLFHYLEWCWRADDENGAPKPRLPFEHVFHKNAYNSNAKEQREAIQKYDEEISEYYKERTNGKRQETWSQQVRVLKW